MGVIQSDLRCAGFTNYVMITDRGYGTVQILEANILHDQPAIMCEDRPQVYQRQNRQPWRLQCPSGRNGDRTLTASCITNSTTLTTRYMERASRKETASKMRLNLFFNPSWRSEGQINIDVKVEGQRSSLQQMIDWQRGSP